MLTTADLPPCVPTRSGSVSRFIYTHVLHAEKLLHVELIAAKHRFASELKAEYEEAKQILPCVVCPSGFYSDLEEVLDMALSGRVYALPIPANHCRRARFEGGRAVF